MDHRISAGALVIRGDSILLVRHFRVGIHDFWAPPGGGVEGSEELSETAEREVFEETGITIKTSAMAYIDELIDSSGRLVKFWFLADHIGGQINVASNPAPDESIIAAGWFTRQTLPQGYVFPDVLHNRFWDDLRTGFASPIKLPLLHSVF